MHHEFYLSFISTWFLFSFCFDEEPIILHHFQIVKQRFDFCVVFLWSRSIIRSTHLSIGIYFLKSWSHWHQTRVISSVSYNEQIDYAQIKYIYIYIFLRMMDLKPVLTHKNGMFNTSIWYKLVHKVVDFGVWFVLCSRDNLGFQQKWVIMVPLEWSNTIFSSKHNYPYIIWTLFLSIKWGLLLEYLLTRYDYIK